ncbi:hypothetical protein V1264_008976 [Littorina saxatilis]|uniref:Doublecortin domain-containing protein n=1 Tax=Littorina saxatilis TaxID=31220 RepID=A0AAN9ARA2_9CAEN
MARPLPKYAVRGDTHRGMDYDADPPTVYGMPSRKYGAYREAHPVVENIYDIHLQETLPPKFEYRPKNQRDVDLAMEKLPKPKRGNYLDKGMVSEYHDVNMNRVAAKYGSRMDLESVSDYDDNEDEPDTYRRPMPKYGPQTNAPARGGGRGRGRAQTPGQGRTSRWEEDGDSPANEGSTPQNGYNKKPQPNRSGTFTNRRLPRNRGREREVESSPNDRDDSVRRTGGFRKNSPEGNRRLPPNRGRQREAESSPNDRDDSVGRNGGFAKKRPQENMQVNGDRSSNVRVSEKEGKQRQPKVTEKNSPPRTTKYSPRQNGKDISSEPKQKDNQLKEMQPVPKKSQRTNTNQPPETGHFTAYKQTPRASNDTQTKPMERSEKQPFSKKGPTDNERAEKQPFSKKGPTDNERAEKQPFSKKGPTDNERAEKQPFSKKGPTDNERAEKQPFSKKGPTDNERAEKQPFSKKGPTDNERAEKQPFSKKGSRYETQPTSNGGSTSDQQTLSMKGRQKDTKGGNLPEAKDPLRKKRSEVDSHPALKENSHREDKLSSKDGSPCKPGENADNKYAQIDPSPKKGHAKSYDVEPGHNRRYQVSGKYRKIDTHGKIIKCWANGNDTKAPRTVLLPAVQRNKPVTLDSVLEQVSMVLCEECNGPVEKLYLPNGIKVMSLDQILPNAHYVALRRTDTFKRAHYKEVSLKNLSTSPRLERRSMLPPLSRSTKTSSQSSPEHSYASNNGSENSYSQRSRDRPYRRDKARREEDQVFHARPVKHKRSSEKARPVDYDQDNGGVFKAKNQNHATRGARAIDDSRQTRTELPVDRQRAQEVQDEEPKGKDKKDKKGRKDEGAGPTPPANEKQRSYKPNARTNVSPGGEQAPKDAERAARARREADDRERADKVRLQREAQQQKKKDKEDQKKREEEEAKRKKGAGKQEQEEKKRRAQEERREERRWKEDEEEKRRAGAKASTPNRHEDRRSARDSSPRVTPISNDEQTRLAQEEDWAATKIQAGFRGYQTRRELATREVENEVNRNGRDSRGDEPPRSEGQDDWGPGPVDDFDNQAQDSEEKAATTLQAGFRGYKARQEVREMRQTQEVKERAASDSSPAPAKSLSPIPNDKDSDLSAADAEHAAASRIQASFRGHQTRKELASQAEAKQAEAAEAQAENEAAAKIQASFRGHQTRKELAAQSESENAAAVKIQAGFRGHQTRKELAANQKDEGASGEPAKEGTELSISNNTNTHK